MAGRWATTKSPSRSRNVAEQGKITWIVDPDGDGTLDTATVNGGEPIMQFQVGATLTASVTDDDIAGSTKDVTSPIWRWYRSESKTSTGEMIDGETSATYTVDLADRQMYLRAVAHYVVTGKVVQETASLTSEYPVKETRVAPNKLKFDPATVSRSVPEGDKGMNVGNPVTATGSHGAVNYTLTGADADRFDIDEKTGQITTAVKLDYEGDVVATAEALGSCADAAADTPDTTCTVTVTATDASGEASSPVATVTITITDVNEKPTFPTGASTTITRDENMTPLADTGSEADVTYTATDPEGQSLIYSLVGQDRAKFQLSAAQVLSFREEPDYEMPADANRDNVYEVTVRASDGTMHADHMVKVTVESVDEAPVITGRDSVNYAENGMDDVATFTATDPEGRDAYRLGHCGGRWRPRRCWRSDGRRQRRRRLLRNRRRRDAQVQQPARLRERGNY